MTRPHPFGRETAGDCDDANAERDAQEIADDQKGDRELHVEMDNLTVEQPVTPAKEDDHE